MIAQYFPPDFGGASTRAFNAAKGLIMQGCNVIVVCGFPHYPYGKIPKEYSKKIISRETIDGIQIIRTRMPAISHSSNTKRVFLHISFFFSALLGIPYIKNIDVILAMNQNFFAFYTSLFFKLFFRKNIVRNVDDLWPEVFYDLGIVKSKFSKKILDGIASFSYKKSKALTPVSKGYVETLISKYHVPKEKIIVIEHGVDTELFVPREKKNEQLTNVMYSGIINVGYDFELVLETAKLLKNHPIKLIIRGMGEGSRHLEDKIKSEKINNLELNTKLLPKKELVSFLNTADIFLLPMNSTLATNKGFPTKILEYQALGKPIICISSGESGRYIKETKSGLVTSSRDPKELMELILKLTNDKSLSKTLGQNGLKNIKENMTLEIVGKKFLNVIEKCIKK